MAQDSQAQLRRKRNATMKILKKKVAAAEGKVAPAKKRAPKKKAAAAK